MKELYTYPREKNMISTNILLCKARKRLAIVKEGIVKIWFSILELSNVFFKRTNYSFEHTLKVRQSNTSVIIKTKTYKYSSNSF